LFIKTDEVLFLVVELVRGVLVVTLVFEKTVVVIVAIFVDILELDKVITGVVVEVVEVVVVVVGG
jgi:hypothetical protein